MSALHSLSSKQHYDTEGIFQIYKKIDKKMSKDIAFLMKICYFCYIL